MTAYVRLIDAAIEDLVVLKDKNQQALRWSLKKMLLLQEDPYAGEPLLGALVGWRKLTVSDRHWRIVWRPVTQDDGLTSVEIAEVWTVGARSDSEVYAEMRQRVESLPANPANAALVDVIEQLGSHIIGVIEQPLPAEPLPDWLRNRLIHTAGMTPIEVDSLTLEQAVDAWTTWTSGVRPETI